MTWTIWCLGDIDYFVSTLNAVAMLFNDDIFNQLLMVGGIIGIFALYLQYLSSGNISWSGAGAGWLRHIVVIMVVAKFMFGTSTTVLVQDYYSLASQQVENVPYGLAAAGSIISRVGYTITQKMEQAFSSPAMLENGF